MNKERYNDPTADIAIGNVVREEKRKEKYARNQCGNKPEKAKPTIKENNN